MSKYEWSSDKRKLGLAAKDIYAYDEGELFDNELLTDYGAVVVKELVELETGFAV